jgi:hypothetical protein
MTVVELTAHPGSADPVPDRVSVVVGWQAMTRQLVLQYRFLGDPARVRLPAPALPGRADGLWRHSCCEAFLGRSGATDYCEFNFSASGEWAAYRFSARRQGMAPLEGLDPPVIVLTRSADEIILEARLDLAPLAPVRPAEFRLGLAAVVQDDQDRQSFWALRHAPGRPDFHDPSSFLLHLDAPGLQPPQEPTP